MTLRNSQSPSE